MVCIEMAAKLESLDSAGASTASAVREDLEINGITRIRYAEAYCIEGISGKEATEIAEKVLLDPIAQLYSIDSSAYSDFDFLVEVKYHNDVTDNLAITTKEAIEDFLGKKIPGKIATSRKFYIYGGISMRDAEKIASGLLANGMIEACRIEAKA